MALRVLLADESSTIKKVIQLSLQDFDVDVKSVTIGLDVLSVAKQFRPDVVFADVLLAKRSGYEVCHDLKNDPETSMIPVILMWSGFMEIDEQKARLCGADRRLEKPFDASALRQLVQDLISKTQSNPVSSFLQFPPLPPFEEPKKPAPGANPNAGGMTTQSGDSHMGAPMNAKPTGAPNIPNRPAGVGAPVQSVEEAALIIDDVDSGSENDEWVQQPINPRAQTQTPPATQFQTPQMPASRPKEDEFTEFPLTQQQAPQQRQQPAKAPGAAQNLGQTIANQTAQIAKQSGMPAGSEQMMREEIQKWLAAHMPDIAERLIREEINRLLQESEKTIQSP